MRLCDPIDSKSSFSQRRKDTMARSHIGTFCFSHETHEVNLPGSVKNKNKNKEKKDSNE